MMFSRSRETLVNRGAAHRRWIAAAAVWVAVGAACGSSEGTSGADKVGNERDPVTLTLATSEEDKGTPAAVIEAFINAVDEATGGRVVIEPRFLVHWEELEWDQRVISDVADGEFDLVLARAGAWNTVGVTTLDALELPGLIESDEQADRVVADHSLVERLLAGVDDIGLTGLGLYPEEPRYLVSLDGTSGFAPVDLRGRIIRAPLERDGVRRLSGDRNDTGRHVIQGLHDSGVRRQHHDDRHSDVPDRGDVVGRRWPRRSR